MNGDNILTVEKLSKYYKNFRLENVSFSIGQGQVTGLIGPNGAGKSTTLKLILGILKADEGRILFAKKGEPVKEGSACKENIGYVGENVEYFPQCRLSELRKFYSSFYRTWDDGRYRELLQRLDLTEGYKMSELSKGMRVKFALSLALSHNPLLLLMDEPTSGLDPLVRNEVLAILKDYVRNNQAGVLFSSHITEDMEKIADELLFLYQGKIIETCRTEEIMAKHIAIDAYLEDMIKES